MRDPLCKFGSKETVELLIKEFNADFYAVDDSGRNCFLCAASAGKVDTMKYLNLLDNQMYRAVDNDGKNALALAEAGGHREAIIFLFEEFEFSQDATENFSGFDWLNRAILDIDNIVQKLPMYLG